MILTESRASCAPIGRCRHEQSVINKDWRLLLEATLDDIQLMYIL